MQRVARGIIFGFAFLIPQLAQAATIYVPQQYPTIQAAVNMAQNGDIITLAPGVYQEDVSASRLVSGPVFLLRIVGVGQPFETTIKGSILVHYFAGSAPLYTLIQVENLTVRAAEQPLLPAAGVNVVANLVVLSNCIVEGHQYGIYVQAGGEARAVRTIVTGNEIGIGFNSGNGSARVMNSVLIRNARAGIQTSWGGKNVYVLESLVAWNGRGVNSGPRGGLLIEASSKPYTVSSLTLRNTVFQTNATQHVYLALGAQLTDSGGNQYRDPSTISGVSK